ncbi:MAG: branched-chain amino acid ABC transporter permease [Candidatus Riflebacteria bacterium]|nr:branched-chain amino acid ABC transporter permease [Candidatus Riflebacteria bacterium]
MSDQSGASGNLDPSPVSSSSYTKSVSDFIGIGLLLFLLVLPKLSVLFGAIENYIFPAPYGRFQNLLSSNFLHVLILIFLYSAMSQAWNIIGGYCGQISFGHSVFFGIGAYGAGMSVVKYGMVPWPGVVAGAFAASLIALMISYPCFKLRGHYFAIATFAVVEIFNRMFMVWDWINGALGLDYPIIEEGWKQFIWYDSKVEYYYGALALMTLIFFIVRFLETHRFGYYLRAVREGAEIAESLGVDSTRVKLSAMALSAGITALCGSFFVQYNLRVDPPMVMSLDMSLNFVLITVLGGIGTLWGPFLGALVLIPLQEYTRAWWSGDGLDLIIFGFMIVIVVLKQPQGIQGIVSNMFKTKKRE